MKLKIQNKARAKPSKIPKATQPNSPKTKPKMFTYKRPAFFYESPLDELFRDTDAYFFAQPKRFRQCGNGCGNRARKAGANRNCGSGNSARNAVAFRNQDPFGVDQMMQVAPFGANFGQIAPFGMRQNMQNMDGSFDALMSPYFTNFITPTFKKNEPEPSTKITTIAPPANLKINPENVNVHIDKDKNTMKISYQQKDENSFYQFQKMETLPKYVKEQDLYEGVKCQMLDGKLRVILPENEAEKLAIAAEKEKVDAEKEKGENAKKEGKITKNNETENVTIEIVDEAKNDGDEKKLKGDAVMEEV